MFIPPYVSMLSVLRKYKFGCTLQYTASICRVCIKPKRICSDIRWPFRKKQMRIENPFSDIHLCVILCILINAPLASLCMPVSFGFRKHQMMLVVLAVMFDNLEFRVSGLKNIFNFVVQLHCILCWFPCFSMLEFKPHFSSVRHCNIT